MKILITGAGGFIGKRLCQTLSEAGHELAALARDPQAARRSAPALSAAFAWDALRQYAPREAFDGVQAVIHLAGESVAGRWTAGKKKAIYDSRIQGTKHLVDTLATLDQKPATLISASAIGYYGERGEDLLDEAQPPGRDFLAGVCKDWEAQTARAQALGVRLVQLRTGIVLGPEGGALGALLPLAKLGLSGPLGGGHQWWSWIHRDDAAGLIQHALNNPLTGPVNAVSPHPVRQREFAKTLGRALKRPAFLPAPALALKLVLGEFSSELLSSKRVLPQKAQASGYAFKFAELEAALRQILG